MTAAGLSVAMCTYNGARYLEDQLRSIGAQTRRPDEVVICDDASTDGTVRILREFARTAPFPVIVAVNPARLGSTRNFERAVQMTRGRTIALSDQDDVWRPDKLRRLEATLAALPVPGCVFSDAEVVDEGLRPLGHRLWDAVRLGPRRQRQMARGAAVDVLLRQNVVTGATMAFRRDLLSLIVPIPPAWVHDGWIALLAAATGACLPLAEPLVSYRQHPAQQIGGLRLTLAQQIAAARRMDARWFSDLADCYAVARDRLRARCSEEVIAKLAEKVAHCRQRARIRACGGPRLPLVFRELSTLRYRRYSLGWKSVAHDLLLP